MLRTVCQCLLTTVMEGKKVKKTINRMLFAAACMICVLCLLTISMANSTYADTPSRYCMNEGGYCEWFADIGGGSYELCGDGQCVVTTHGGGEPACVCQCAGITLPSYYCQLWQ